MIPCAPPGNNALGDEGSRSLEVGGPLLERRVRDAPDYSLSIARFLGSAHRACILSGRDAGDALEVPMELALVVEPHACRDLRLRNARARSAPARPTSR